MGIITWWRRRNDKRRGQFPTPRLARRMCALMAAMLRNPDDRNYVIPLAVVTGMSVGSVSVTLVHMAALELVESDKDDDGQRWYALTKKAHVWAADAML